MRGLAMRVGRGARRLYSPRISTEEGLRKRRASSEGLVEDDRDRVTQVQASDRADRWDRPHMLSAAYELGRQPNGLFPEDQRVAGVERRVQIRLWCVRRKQMNSTISVCFLERSERVVTANVHELPVVEPSAANRVVVDGEAERADEMKRGLGRAAGPRDRAGVGRNLRFDQDDVERLCQGVCTELRALGHAASYDRG